MGPGRAGMAPTSGPGWARNAGKQSTWRIWTGPLRKRDGTWTGPGLDPGEGLDGTPRDSNRLLGISDTCFTRSSSEKSFPEDLGVMTSGIFFGRGPTEGGGFHTPVRGTMFFGSDAVAPEPSRECDITFFVKRQRDDNKKQNLRFWGGGLGKFEGSRPNTLFFLGNAMTIKGWKCESCCRKILFLLRRHRLWSRDNQICATDCATVLWRGSECRVTVLSSQVTRDCCFPRLRSPPLKKGPATQKRALYVEIFEARYESILSVWPECSHRCASLKKSPMKAVAMCESDQNVNRANLYENNWF